jgi:23S rRNA (guanosine2251-2'-O)-methyltransferase
MEALKSKTPLNKVFIRTGKSDKRIDQIKKLCEINRVVYQLVPQQFINRKVGSRNQGVFAEISPVRFFELDTVLESIDTGLLLILDGINDAGNMGAIIRSAVAAGIDGILVPHRNSAPINETVLKTSAGSLMQAKIIRSKNLANDINRLKEAGFWIIGTDKEQGIEYYKFDFAPNCAIVVGNEARGISPIVRKRTDQFVFIPHDPVVDSLNVSVSTGIIIFEALRQKL